MSIPTVSKKALIEAASHNIAVIKALQNDPNNQSIFNKYAKILQKQPGLSTFMTNTATLAITKQSGYITAQELLIYTIVLLNSFYIQEKMDKSNYKEETHDTSLPIGEQFKQIVKQLENTKKEEEK